MIIKNGVSKNAGRELNDKIIDTHAWANWAAFSFTQIAINVRTNNIFLYFSDP